MPELKDLVVEEPALLPGVGHVGGWPVCRTVDIRHIGVIEDPALALRVDAEHQLVGGDAVVDVVLDRLVHVELVAGVADKPLLPPSVQRLVDTSEDIKRSSVVVVGHHVDPEFYFI